jgi:hypothetical protein
MKARAMPSQCERVMAYIRRHGSITQMEAMRDIGVMRLASRISDLRRRGVPVRMTPKKVVNRYGEWCRVACYTIDDEEGEQR